MLVALASGMIFGALHVSGGPHITQGVATTWGFLILSLCFLEWRKKSRRRAIAVTALVHTCTNGLVFVVVLTAVLLGAENPLVKTVSASPPGQQIQISVKTRPGAGASSPRSSVSPGNVRGEEELSAKEKRQAYDKAFPGFGPLEFEFASEDLYPDWKKNIAP